MFTCFKHRIENREIKKEIKGMPINPDRAGVALIVGHTAKKKGAYSKHLKVAEYYFNKKLAVDVKNSYQETKGQFCGIYFRNSQGIAKAYREAMKQNPRMILELHFNSATPAATGCEVLYNPKGDKLGVNEEYLSDRLSQKISNSLGIRDRGSKTRAKKGERGFYNLSQVSVIPSLIVEPFFGSNKSDCKKMTKNYDKMVKSIVTFLIEA